MLREVLVSVGAACIIGAQLPALANCPGDLNADGAVDGSDLGKLIRAWGTPFGDLDGDGATGSADVGLLLDGWGPCPEKCDGLFHDMKFAQQPSNIVEKGWTAIVDGVVSVESDGTAKGSIDVTFLDGAAATIAFDGLDVVVAADGATVDLNACGDPMTVFVNGAETPVADLLALGADEFAAAATPSQLSPTALACTSLVALTGTGQWQCYADAELASGNDGVAASCKPSCKEAAMAVSLVFLAGSAAICIAATIACAWFSVMTLGGVTVACALLALLCEGLALYGTEWVYAKVLASWSGT